jgi:hypothetical protein
VVIHTSRWHGSAHCGSARRPPCGSWRAKRACRPESPAGDQTLTAGSNPSPRGSGRLSRGEHGAQRARDVWSSLRSGVSAFPPARAEALRPCGMAAGARALHLRTLPDRFAGDPRPRARSRCRQGRRRPPNRSVRESRQRPSRQGRPLPVPFWRTSAVHVARILSECRRGGFGSALATCTGAYHPVLVARRL